MYREFLVGGIAEMMGVDRPFDVSEVVHNLAMPGHVGSGIATTMASAAVIRALTLPGCSSVADGVSAILRDVLGSTTSDGRSLRYVDGRYVVTPPPSLLDRLNEVAAEEMAASVSQ